MRVCVVGCGAVGSLFAANLAQLDDVEVWAYDVSQAHVDAINTRRAAAVGRRRGPRAAARDDGRRLSCRPATSASSRRRRCTPTSAIAATAHAFAGGCRLLGAERDRQRGGDRRARRARDPRHDVPGREDPRARPRAVGREGRHDARPVRAEAGVDGRRSSALADACTRGGMPTTAVADARGRAVAQGDLQRRHEPGRRAHRPHARPRLRATRRYGASSPASSTRARPSRPRRASSSTPTRRS